ncbi:MAG: V4R domain-containing protein [Candidatus Hodarchaeota archaeon]
MISGVYIFFVSGLPIFHMNLGLNERESMNQILFGGISSAINMLIKELAHSDLQSINVEDGKLKYSISNELIFVLHSKGQKGDEISGFLLKQIQNEFLEDYEVIIKNSDRNVIDSSLFQPFKTKVREMYRSVLELSETHENLFNFIPDDIPLSLVNELLKEGDNLIEGFPRDTIRLVRRLDEKFDRDIKKRIIFSLGIYFGIEISKREFPTRVSLNQDEILKLLNEISVAKYNKSERLFTFAICPICRGRVSTEPICDFFSGFIEGCFDNPNLQVKEITCKASGDKSCTYSLIYSRDQFR